MQLVLEDIQQSGVMDYVSAWFYKASKYIQNTKIKVAFVSTNSISQGEQVGILWSKLLSKYKIKIHFAHQTFNWSNEAKSNAAVHVIIVGFANFDTDNKKLFEYENIKAEAHERNVKNINPYLVEADDIVITNRSKPLCNVSAMKYGSKPTDGGFFLLSDEEKNELISKNKNAEQFIKPFLSGREFLRNINRWVIWLVDANPSELKKSPEILKRIEQVKKFRLSSTAKSTRDYPYHSLFRQITQPDNDYVLIPRTTSENRVYIPMGFFSKDIIIGDTCQAIPNGDLFLFGQLTSLMHMAWVKYTCGRLKSDYRYSKDLVYNNYPFPKNVNEKQKLAVEEKAQNVLDIRASFNDCSLADLYDPLSMPPNLKKAHQELDKAVDNCYGTKSFKNDKERIEFLFGLYEEYLGE